MNDVQEFSETKLNFGGLTPRHFEIRAKFAKKSENGHKQNTTKSREKAHGG